MKKSCYTCGSFSVTRWGVHNTKQRFRCKDCGQLFFWRNDHKKTANRFFWFVKWVMDRRVYRNLSGEMGLSERSISRLFENYLVQAPLIPVKSKTGVYLLIDATYLPRVVCV